MFKHLLRFVLLVALAVPLGTRAQSTPDSVYTMGTTGSDTLRICSAVIYDNGGATGSYATNCNFTLVLLPSVDGNHVLISGTSVTEGQWDYLTIYEGVGTSGNVLFRDNVSSVETTPIPAISAAALTIVFYSDGSVVKDGFEINVSCVDPTALPPVVALPATGHTTINVPYNVAAVLSMGANVSYTWSSTMADAGDAIASNADSIYTITYTAEGTDVITVIATNSNGADTATMTVSVVDLSPITAFPYSTGFEEEQDTLWHFNNLCNQWWIGSAVNNTAEGARAMYISADSGATNSYTEDCYGNTYAYRYFTFEPGQYTLSFDWKAAGYYDDYDEYQYEYLTAYLGNPEDDLAASSISYSGWENLSGALGNETTWQHFNGVITITEAGVYPVILRWNTSGYSPYQTNPPAAVDNISIERLACPAVTNLAIDNVTADSIVFHWSAGGEETAWLVSLDGETWEDADDTAYVFDGLTANTVYTVHVAANCGDDTSLVSTITTRTACGTISNLPWVEDFENQPSGNFPYCWTKNGGSTYVRNYESMAHGGSQFLNFSGSTSNMAVLPAVSVPLNTLTLNFWTRPESFTDTNCGTFSVGYVTNLDSLTSSFVALQTYSYNDFSGWEQKEIALDTLPDEAVALAFRHNANSTYWYWYVDDVTLYVPATCDAPTAVVLANATTTSLTATVTGEATGTYRYLLTNAAGVQVDSVVATATTNTFNGLTPGTKYTVSVSAVCSDGSVTLPVSASAYTNCEAVSELPYELDLTNLATGNTAEFDPCWVKGGTTSDGYPYVTTSGGKCLVYNIYSEYDYAFAIMPELDEDIALNTLELSFDAKTAIAYYGSYEGQLTIGVIDGNTYTDETPMDVVATVNITATSYETQYVSFANYTGTKSRIVILANGGSEDYDNYAYIKNISLHLLPSCIMPQELTVVSMNDTSATFSWSGDADEYVYIVSRNGSQVDSNTVTDTFATVMGLAMGNTYTFQVRSVCDDATSAWTSTSVYIGYCTPTPSSVDGDGITNVIFGNAPEVVNDNPVFGWSTGYYLDRTDSVGATFPGGAVNMSLTFETGYAYETYIWVDWNNNMVFDANELVYSGISEDDDVSTILASFPVPATQDTGLYRLRIGAGDPTIGSTISGTNPCFGGDYGIALDYTLHVTEAPDCIAPAGLVVTGTSDNSISISFMGVDDGSYQVSICDSAATTTLNTATIDTNVHTFTGLTASTWYTIYVAALCDGTVTDSVSVRASTTVAGAPVPYSTGFEAADDVAWTILNGTQTNAWYIDTAAHRTGARALYISADSGATNTYNNNSTSNVYAYKTFTFAPGQYAISFDWKANGESSYDYLRAYLAPAATTFTAGTTLSAGANWIDLGGRLNGQTEWQTSETVAEIAAAGTYHLVFFWHNDGSDGSQTPAAVDNIAISIVTCTAPDSLKVLATTTTSATLDWQATDTETSWVLNINGRDTVVNAHPVTINGLTAGTFYTARVRAICGAGDTSFATPTVAFWTECANFNVPFVEDFSNPLFSPCWIDTARVMSTSWRQAIESGYGTNNGYIYSRTAYSNQNGNDWLISPVINIPANTTDLNLAYMIAGLPYSYSSSSYARYEVYVSPTGGSSFADFTDTLIVDTLNSNYFERMYLPMAAYANQSIRIAIRNSSYYGGEIYLANFGVRYTNLPLYGVRGRTVAYTNDTISWKAHRYEGDTTTMTFSWTSTMATAGQGILLNGATDSASMVYTAAGIDTMMFVATNTHGADTIRWLVNVYDCSPIVALPWSENFNNITGTAYSAEGTVPGCWEVSSNATSQPLPHVVATGGSYAFSPDNTNSLGITCGAPASGYADTAYVKMPGFAATTNTLELSFWMGTESDTYGTLSVGYFDANDLFVSVKEIPASSTTQYSTYNGTYGTTDTVTFDSVPDGNYRIGFRWVYNLSYYSVCLDNIVVNGVTPDCDAPVIDTVSAGETTVTINFSVEAENFQVAIAEDWNEESVVPVNLTSNNYTFEGLTPATAYTVGVRAVCAEGLYSEWVVSNITTEAHPCDVPTALTSSNVTLNSATLGWTAVEGQEKWQIHLTGEGYDQYHLATANPFNVTGLSYGVEYTFQVRAICSEGDTSEWSTPAHFTTIACEGVTNVTVGSVTANSAVISWTAPTGATRFVVNYGFQGFDQGTGSFDTVENATSCTLSGLTANTPYDVYVRTLCEGGTASAWSSVVNFTTSRGTGIDDVNAANVSLYPNPASSTVTLKGIEGKATVTVVDMNGRKAGEWTVNEGELTIDVTDMAQGAYFVRIVGEQVNAIRKLIVR